MRWRTDLSGSGTRNENLIILIVFVVWFCVISLIIPILSKMMQTRSDSRVYGSNYVKHKDSNRLWKHLCQHWSIKFQWWVQPGDSICFIDKKVVARRLVAVIKFWLIEHCDLCRILFIVNNSIVHEILVDNFVTTKSLEITLKSKPAVSLWRFSTRDLTLVCCQKWITTPAKMSLWLTNTFRDGLINFLPTIPTRQQSSRNYPARLKTLKQSRLNIYNNKFQEIQPGAFKDLQERSNNLTTSR